MIQWSFVLNSAALGVGLAMDAFSVSMANGLRDPDMRRRTRVTIAGTFAFFQFLMPLVGWVCVHGMLAFFSAMQRFIPWFALIVLSIIGGKMLWAGLSGGEDEETRSLGRGTLLMQGVATSIDALSVGFTIADYGAGAALLASVIIAAVTFVICLAGVRIGRRFGTRFSGRAAVLGGAILIAVGLEIFLKGVLGG